MTKKNKENVNETPESKTPEPEVSQTPQTPDEASTATGETPETQTPEGGSQAASTADLDSHARALGVVDWELAGLRVALGWAPGKQVSREDFSKALKAYRNRRAGSGRINI